MSLLLEALSGSGCLHSLDSLADYPQDFSNPALQSSLGCSLGSSQPPRQSACARPLAATTQREVWQNFIKRASENTYNDNKDIIEEELETLIFCTGVPPLPSFPFPLKWTLKDLLLTITMRTRFLASVAIAHNN